MRVGCRIEVVVADEWIVVVLLDARASECCFLHKVHGGDTLRTGISLVWDKLQKNYGQNN